MQWVVGIDMVAGKMLACSESGEHVELSRLASEGVPTMPYSPPYRERSVTVRMSAKGGLEVPFHAWTRVKPDTFLDWFGVKPVGEVCRHDMFSSHVDGVDMLVPALVFLRAIFRPTSELLERAFRPHFLDFATYLDMAEEPPKLMPNPTLPASVFALGKASPLPLFAWLYCHPTARAMVASVHAHAVAGRVGLQLPNGVATMAVRGKRIGNHLLVTDMTITSVTPGDRPAPSCDLTRRKYLLRGASELADDERAVHVKRMPRVPTRAGGYVELSESEWAEIGPILQTRKGAQKRLCRRAILDGILNKLHSGSPWQLIPYREGSAGNARAAFTRWARSGAMASIYEVLKRRRGVQLVAERTPPPNLILQPSWLRERLGTSVLQRHLFLDSGHMPAVGE